MNNLAILFLLATLSSCGNNTKNSQTNPDAKPVEVSTSQDEFQKAYFASGCFWCVEAVFESIKGVKEVVSGYSGGTGENPTYENYGAKGHAEAVEVIYNPNIVSYNTLLTVYFGSQNVTQQNGQGPDIGPLYRSIIFFQNEKQKKQIQAKIEEIGKQYDEPVAAEVIPFQKFWRAEAYHQNYERNHPENPYVQKVSIPRLERFKRKFPELLK